NRRLSIVGLADGKQPIASEDHGVVAVFNGEFFDYPELKQRLEARGHQFRTHCDTELIPHLWEDHQEQMFDHLRGQFALAVWDQRRRRLVLARDRFGICPLYWTRQTSADGDWLLFASEIKALLASDMVTARPDLKGIDQVFHFFAVPGPSTCFEGIQLLQPGNYLRIDLGRDGQTAKIDKRVYWAIDFPDQGREEGGDAKPLVDEFERLMWTSVERRLRADVPVVSYLSGGIDSSIVVAMAAKVRGEPIPTFTVQIKTPHLDETSQAAVVSRHIQSDPIVVPVGDSEVLNTYPELIRATEAPVIDTSSTAMLMLAREVHRRGYKVALTGEGSDEWLAGYAWYKFHRLFSFFDVIPGLKMGHGIRRLLYWAVGASPLAKQHIREIRESLGDHSAFHDIYSVMTISRFRFLADDALRQLSGHNPYLELEPNLVRMNRWDPLNRGLYWAGRIHLAGHLLSLKGDRVAMNSSVETRYPFLDEDVFAFLARLHPRWKLRGFQDKYILRLLGERYLPREVAWRPKGMFRAPLDSFFAHQVPPFVDQLLSPESLRKTGWFNIAEVQYWRQRMLEGRLSIRQRSMVELGMVGVVTTQLWYHTFIDSTLADLPGGWQRPQRAPVHELAAL
ncbi:MAG: asparagine synthase (glutamine-hydrolyzing), partial [Gemmataceae bacterium]|nr:asparagine synthase (glutamine-hydrolyzing) [Gemmataceae bacterium]